jgi:hypothetical protein
MTQHGLGALLESLAENRAAAQQRSAHSRPLTTDTRKDESQFPILHPASVIPHDAASLIAVRPAAKALQEIAPIRTHRHQTVLLMGSSSRSGVTHIGKRHVRVFLEKLLPVRGRLP